MPAAVGRKIKYRFPAWQAPEVFSKRQPLIFSYYLCLCGSFFSSRICGIYVMCVPYQYSCLRPSGRCRVKRSFSTTFSNSLYADLPQKLSSPALSEIPFRKVQAKVPFARHLLERSVRPSTHLRKVSRKSGKLTHLRKVEKACGVGKSSSRRSRGGGASTHLRKVSRKSEKSTHLRKVEKACGVGKSSSRRSRGGGASTHLRKVSRKSEKSTHLRKVEKACGVGKSSSRRSRGGGASTHLRKVSRKSGKSTHLRKVEMVRGGKELLIIRRGRS